MQAVRYTDLQREAQKAGNARTPENPCGRIRTALEIRIRGHFKEPNTMWNRLIPYAVLLCAALLLAACGLVPADEPAPVAEPTEATAKPAEVAEPPPTLTVTVTSNANVRTGPGTEHDIGFWLTVDTPVDVTGRNADGDWLQIEHDGRTGWLFAALTDITDTQLVALPGEAAPQMTDEPAPAEESMADEPAPVVEPEPVAEPAPAPEPDPAPADAPTPEPTVEPATEPAPARTTATVTGTVVNLRRGPGTEHAIDGQVREGMQLSVTGRNAAGDWLQIISPQAAGELVWIFGALTDIDTATVLTLAEVTVVEVRVEAPVAPDEPAAPVATPALRPASPGAATIQDCAQWHRVNPNETRLAQITDWYGLDLAAVAARNGLNPEAPLTTGMELCLDLGEPGHRTAPPTVPGIPTAPRPAPAGAPGAVVRMETGDCRTHGGFAYECPDLPDFPERAVKSVPGVPVLYHAPGSYDRSEHPGLAYEWELVFSDSSSMWDWRVRDFQGCYDALRVHMGDIPETEGLTRLEYRLSDSLLGENFGDRDGMKVSTSVTSPGRFWDQRPSGWPDWNVNALPHPDLAWARIRCYTPRAMPAGEVFCRVAPRWGNSGSIHLNASMTYVLSVAAEQLSNKARTRQYSLTHPELLRYNAYLYPLVDNRTGDPAGSGPCMEVTRAG